MSDNKPSASAGVEMGDVYTLALDVSLTYANRLPPSVVELARKIVTACDSDAPKALSRETK